MAYRQKVCKLAPAKYCIIAHAQWASRLGSVEDPGHGTSICRQSALGYDLAISSMV